MKANVDLNVNVNEIRDVKYVTPEELKAMFADPSKCFFVFFFFGVFIRQWLTYLFRCPYDTLVQAYL